MVVKLNRRLQYHIDGIINQTCSLTHCINQITSIVIYLYLEYLHYSKTYKA